MRLIVDLQYFSPFIFYLHLSDFKYCIFDQYEHYQKMSFRNRCTLLGGNGPIALSVPLVGGRNQKTRMKDVRILNQENWQGRHWKTIESCYNKSPWLEYYRDELARLYTRKFDYLIEWNFSCFQWAADKMSIKTFCTLSEEYIENYDMNSCIDWRGKLVPSTINSEFRDVARYPQVFEDRFGFIPNLSVLDYLFCAGPVS